MDIHFCYSNAFWHPTILTIGMQISGWIVARSAYNRTNDQACSLHASPSHSNHLGFEGHVHGVITASHASAYV
jgi:hypothetical protein